MGEDGFRNAHNVTTPDKPLKSQQRCSLLLLRNPLQEVSSKKGPARFGNGDGGRDTPSGGPD
jgi:hypothetical protein